MPADLQPSMERWESLRSSGSSAWRVSTNGFVRALAARNPCRPTLTPAATTARSTSASQDACLLVPEAWAERGMATISVCLLFSLFHSDGWPRDPMGPVIRLAP